MPLSRITAQVRAIMPLRKELMKKIIKVIKGWDWVDGELVHKGSSISLSELKAKAEHEELEEVIEALYKLALSAYNEGLPIMSDKEFTDTFGETKDVDYNKLTQPHTHPMGGIKFYTDIEEVEAWAKTTYPNLNLYTPDFVIEPKWDGCAVSIEGVVREGKVITMSILTRGSRQVGNVIPNLTPDNPTLRIPINFMVRGEMVCTWEMFSCINKEREIAGLDLYKHPRGVASAAIAQGKVDSPLIERLKFIPYLISGKTTADTKILERKYNSFDSYVRIKSKEALIRLLQSITSEYYIPCDGVVIKTHRNQYDYSVRDTTKYIAFKPYATPHRTTIQNITYQVSGFGRLSPVVHVAPIVIDNKKISKLSGHNPEWLDNRGAGKGSGINIGLAGGVIPYIIDVPKPTTYYPPTVCPSCFYPVTRNGKDTTCDTGLDCPAQEFARVKYFYSANGVNIRGLGEGLVRDILELDTAYWWELFDLEEAGVTFSNRTLKEIERVEKSLLVSDLLQACHIRGLSKQSSKNLASHVESILEVLEMSPVMLQSVLGWNLERSEILREALSELSELFYYWDTYGNIVSERPKENGVLNGEVICLTGKVPRITKKVLHSHILRLGGKPVDNFSKEVTLLLYGEGTFSRSVYGTTKYQKALYKNIPMMDSEKFIHLHNLTGEKV